jgi:hypothetical protein
MNENPDPAKSLQVISDEAESPGAKPGLLLFGLTVFFLALSILVDLLLGLFR